MDEWIRLAATLVGMAGASVGIMAIVSTRRLPLRLDGAASVLAGILTIVAANLPNLVG